MSVSPAVRPREEPDDLRRTRRRLEHLITELVGEDIRTFEARAASIMRTAPFDGAAARGKLRRAEDDLQVCAVVAALRREVNTRGLFR